MKRLLDAGADATIANVRRVTALHWAAMSKKVGIAKQLLARGGDPGQATVEPWSHDWTDYEVGTTPIDVADAVGSPKVLAALRAHSSK